MMFFVPVEIREPKQEKARTEEEERRRREEIQMALLERREKEMEIEGDF